MDDQAEMLELIIRHAHESQETRDPRQSPLAFTFVPDPDPARPARRAKKGKLSFAFCNFCSEIGERRLAVTSAWPMANSAGGTSVESGVQPANCFNLDG